MGTWCLEEGWPFDRDKNNRIAITGTLISGRLIGLAVK